MNTELTVILLLCAIVVFQQVFFFRQVHKFTDKIMSGSYTAYVQNLGIKEQQQHKPMSGFNIELPQDEGPSELDQLNAMLNPPF